MTKYIVLALFLTGCPHDVCVKSHTARMPDQFGVMLLPDGRGGLTSVPTFQPGYDYEACDEYRRTPE
jgi:hypothetical protein